ncbi:hypothetical protein GETHLI_22620 [Geothrix limicola]|uniref:Outer membrane protein beta-barrel domain-containing protein n=1 Tax=Geothrix limicola TaxID=2927978 RepID=A0ABQ5QHW4_9BACT|nr:hypothetical protein [Geothrix limicola]GLH73760.1 hypothetical protein GETHLI_22620 [Geothrix limicola]
MKRFVGMLSLAALPLAAQSWEVGAFVGQQSYKSFSYQDVTIGHTEVKPDSKTVGALRLGYSLVDVGPALFQINAAYQPKASADIKFNAMGITLGGITKLDHSASSVGLAFIFKAGVSASVGVDYRWDKLEGTFQNLSSSTTYGRPWARANIGFAFPTPLMKPFLGLEVAAPLASTSVGNAGPANDEEALKGMAPKLQIGVYGGIRF